MSQLKQESFANLDWSINLVFYHDLTPFEMRMRSERPSMSVQKFGVEEPVVTAQLLKKTDLKSQPDQWNTAERIPKVAVGGCESDKSLVLLVVQRLVYPSVGSALIRAKSEC